MANDAAHDWDVGDYDTLSQWILELKECHKRVGKNATLSNYIRDLTLIDLKLNMLASPDPVDDVQHEDPPARGDDLESESDSTSPISSPSVPLNTIRVRPRPIVTTPVPAPVATPQDDMVSFKISRPYVRS